MPYTQNRELSWLRFNDRVLKEAADPAVPLLERLKFIAIFNSNLDEFFMIRVGSLTDLHRAGINDVDKNSGMTPTEQLRAVYDAVSPMYKRCARVYDDVTAGLRRAGVEILRADSLSGADAKYVKSYFKSFILPTLSPQIVDPHHPFPHLRSRSVYCAALVRRGGKEHFALIPPPPGAPSLIYLPGEKLRAVPTDEAVLAHFGTVFRDFQCTEKTLISVTRNADVKAEDEVFELDEDFRDRMKKALKKRRSMAPVRLETGGDISDRFMKYLCGAFHLTERQIYRRTYPMDMSFAYRIGERMKSDMTAAMSYPPPPSPERFKGSVVELINRRDVLLSYPYDSMDIFLSLLRECADDPDVLSVKITVYRLAGRSRLVEYLCRAAENGKDVTVLIELRARFDEESNIEWSRQLEQAGCRILYGFETYKVHSKLCLITRKVGGEIGYITQIGTGNYNEKTARLYTDLCLITADRDIGEDADSFFKNMAIGELRGEYGTLLVAPFSLKDKVIRLIAGEAEKGRVGRIIMKLNSIGDPDVIKALRDASAAGVQIDLIVRGICCILPNVAGETENITVRSIVGRFLEHSRIYVFGRGEEAAVYISSADMMTRNTVRRVEVACPVRSAEAKREILRILSLCLDDSVKAHLLTEYGEYVPAVGETRVDCQETLLYSEKRSYSTPKRLTSVFRRIARRGH